MEQLCNLARYLAIGESGLDYTAGNLEKQRGLFRTQIQMAQRLKKPLVLHQRGSASNTTEDVYEEAREMITSVLTKDHHIYLYCYTADWETYMKWTRSFTNLLLGLTWRSV